MSATNAPTTSGDASVGKLDMKLEVQIIPVLVVNGENDRLVPVTTPTCSPPKSSGSCKE